MSKKETVTLVGHVTMTVLNDHTKESYSDGSIETELLTLFKQSRPNEQAFREKHPGWATDYHLAPTRQNLLNWLHIKPGARVLEVGAGCGALTGVLCEKAAAVTALELSPRRASINAQRHKDKKNLDIVVGNLQNLESYKNVTRYDYVVCVGVLEYAGRFIDAPDPFEAFIRQLRSFTKPNGTLILAIENQLGIKYLSGAKEDHTGRYMEGPEDYPHYDGVRTFGKQDLEQLLAQADFKNLDFYYPLPDYKMPGVIYSDRYLPGINTDNIPYSLFPSPNPDQTRQQLFREQSVIGPLARNGLFGPLANSFLVVANDPLSASQPVLAHGSLQRQPKFRTITTLHKKGKSYRVVKQPVSPDGKNHLASLAKTYDVLKKPFSKNFGVCPVQDTPSGAIFDYVGGLSMEELLVRNLLKKDYDGFLKQFLLFTEIVSSLDQSEAIPIKSAAYKQIFGSAFNKKALLVSPGLVDLNFDNIVYDQQSKQYTLIDYEWCFEFPIPKDYVIGRALLYFFKRHWQILRALAGPSNKLQEIGKDLYVPDVLYQALKTYFACAREVSATEQAFQRYVTGQSSDLELYDTPKLINGELPDNTADSYETALRSLDEHKQAINEQQQQIAAMAHKLDKIKKLPFARLASKAHKKLRRSRPNT